MSIHKWLYGGLGILILGLLYLSHAYSVKQAATEASQTAMEKSLAAKDKEMTDRDKANQAKFDALQQRIDDLRTAKQAVQVIQPVVSPAGQIAPQGVTKAELPPDVQKQLPGTPDTHYTLMTDAQLVLLGKRELACQQTEGSLSTCEADKKTMQEKIDALTGQNQKWEQLGVVPRWTAGLGVAKSATNGYTPVAFLDYRIQPKWGLFIGAENKAAFAGVSLHFGATPK